MKRRSLTGLGASVGMIVLILDSKTALAGAKDGVLLCIQTLIPSLFPFFIFSILITNTLTGLSSPLFKPIGKLCGIPQGAESMLAVGLLGGYPTGAQAVGTAYRSGQLNQSDAARMITFCNNAGPSFLFGIVGAMFEQRWVPWILWLILSICAMVVGISTRDTVSTPPLIPSRKPLGMTEALKLSVTAMANVCGWVILFRIGFSFLERWILWLLPQPVQVLISGLLELSNGCMYLKSVESSGLRFVLAAVMLSFGGLCVTMQTYSVNNNVPMHMYLLGKVLQTSLVLLCSCAAQICFSMEDRWKIPVSIPGIAVAVALFFIMLLQKSKKSGSIPAVIGV